MNYKLYGIVDANNVITKFLTEFDDLTDATLLETTGQRNRISQLEISKTVDGINSYKYKFVESTVTERTDNEIKSAYPWMNSHRVKLDQKVHSSISNLGESGINRLIAKENRGTTLDADQIEDINDFLTDADDKADTDFHDVAATNGYTRFGKKLATGSGSRTLELKRFPRGWVANDQIRLVDYGKDPKDFTVTLTAVDSGAKTITFADPGHATKYRRKSSFAYKVG